MWGEMLYNQFELTFAEKMEFEPDNSEDNDIEDYELQELKKQRACLFESQQTSTSLCH